MISTECSLWTKPNSTSLLWNAWKGVLEYLVFLLNSKLSLHVSDSLKLFFLSMRVEDVLEPTKRYKNYGNYMKAAKICLDSCWTKIFKVSWNSLLHVACSHENSRIIRNQKRSEKSCYDAHQILFSSVAVGNCKWKKKRIHQSMKSQWNAGS